MKNLKIILATCLVLAFMGCDKNDEPINNIYDVENGQSLVAFDKSTSNLAVLIDDTGTVDVIIDVATVSTSDRTVTVSVDLDASTANPENYDIPNNVVTIPAGQYQGVLTINGTDISVDPAKKTIVLNIVSTTANSPVIDSSTHTVSIFQVCPVPSTYLVGDYIINDSNANLGENELVTLAISPTDPTVRIFTTTFLPGSSVERPTTIMLSLNCGFFDIAEVDENLTCTQDNPFALDSAGDNNSSFDLDYMDDQVGDVHTINYIEDSYADCGASSLQNFTLTKQ